MSRWRLTAGRLTHSDVISWRSRGGGGGPGLADIPLLFYGLSVELVDNGDKVSESRQANNRIGVCCLYRGIVAG